MGFPNWTRWSRYSVEHRVYRSHRLAGFLRQRGCLTHLRAREIQACGCVSDATIRYNSPILWMRLRDALIEAGREFMSKGVQASLRRSGAKPLLRSIVATAILTALVAVFLVHTVIPAAARLTNGFLAYYVGAQIIKNGEPGARLYDDEWFSGRVKEVSGGQVTDIYLANPPVMAFAWVPFAYLTVQQARKLWIGLSVLWLGIAIGLIATQLSGSWHLLGLAGITALFTLPAPAREQFQLGQIYALLLLLHVIGWRAYSRRQDVLAGVALGLALALKLSGWPIGLLMLSQRRWTAVWSSIVTGISAAAITLPWVGIDAWRAFLVVAVPQAMRRPSATLTVYQDTGGFWQHWFRYDPHLNPHPIFNAPALASILTIGTAAVACFLLIARRRPAYVSFAAAVALVELLSPAAEQYHYIVLLLPLAVLWHQAWVLRSRGALCAACVATLLIAWPMNYRAPHPVWALLLSYPRLIGGWIGFAALLMPWRDDRQVTGNRPSEAESPQ
jgi:glycosyl transferase family 87